MKMRIRFTIPVALVCMLLAHGSQPKSNRIGPPDIYPDPVRTPGAANPQVTQENIKDNICNRQWSTKQIRPPAEYTTKLKMNQLQEYGDTVHQARAQLINPNTGKVDTTRCVAHSEITLKRGQEILAGDWYACYESIKKGKPCK